MPFDFDERLPDSPFVEMIWRTRSDHHGGRFISRAVTGWELVLTTQEGKTTLTVRGPETHATPAPIPENAAFLGITFKVGTYMPHLSAKTLVDDAIHLPGARRDTFWLHSDTRELPTYDNADIFVEHLVRDGLVERNPVVAAVLEDRPPAMSLRSIQRHFLRTTGLTHKSIQQIERAHRAAELLGQGLPIFDAAFETGYSDQAHLTRSLKRYLGQTPGEIVRPGYG